MPDPERRKLQRFDLRIPAWLMPTGPETGRKVPVTTRDISADGAFFFTNEPLTVGDPVTACVVLPAREGQLQMPNKIGVNFKGQVVRIEMSGIAVRFNRQWVVGRVIADTSASSHGQSPQSWVPLVTPSK